MNRFGRETEAFFLALGTIVGVGMFGIPYVFAHAGFLTGVLDLTLLAGAVSLVHLAYADVVVVSGVRHRLPGYAGMHLGALARWISIVSYLAGLFGTLLAYIVLGGAFLSTLIGGIFPASPPVVGVLLFYLLGALVMLRGVRFEGLANGILTLILVGAILSFGVLLLPRVEASFLRGFDAWALFGPYGVLLFSLAGAAVIPDMSVILGPERRSSLRKIVFLGTVSAAFLYLLFATAVVGVTGENTTPDAIHGVATVFGAKFLLFGAFIGFLAAITSFIPLGAVLKSVLSEDVGLKKHTAWLLTLGVPLLLFLLGLQDFILIISIIGALGFGIDSILILLMHRRLPRTHTISLPLLASVALALLFAVGVIIELTRLT